jgi:diguanylate cyclase
MAAAIRTPIVVDGLPLSLGASAGVALYPRDGGDTAALLVHADGAMYQSKRRTAGSSAVALQQHDGGPGRLALMVELSKALPRGELSLQWQPQVDGRGGVPCVEALLRWHHPLFGDVSPAVFMPMVESTDMVEAVTLHVVDEAFAQLRRWLLAGVDLRIAINLGARNLLDSKLPYELRTRLERADVPAERVTLEITEHCLVQEPELTVPVLHELHDLGFTISIDDFGTGFSSLAYLRTLPVSELKVDRSFVMALDDPKGETLVSAIVGLAGGLGMDVVAEGVELPHLREKAFALGFDRAQGYAIAHPLPSAAVPDFVRSARRAHLEVVQGAATPEQAC